jgi:signal transduction histidine kinase/CheY-like chemotaxis protein
LSEKNENDRLTFDKWQRKVGATWYAGFPLLGKGGVVGVLSCFAERDPQLDTDRIGLLKAFADQAAIALCHNRLHKEVETFKARLHQAEKHITLSAMMRGLAHNLNNILGVIMTRAQLLTLGTERPETLQELETIEQAAQEGAGFIRRFAEYSESPDRADISSIVDLTSTVEKVVTLTKGRWRHDPLARGIKIDLKVDLPTDLRVLVADEMELWGVLAELVFNAVDAMPQGGRLNFSADVAGQMVALKITDTGVGMDERTKRRIFEPHFTTKGVNGTGLGLSNALSFAHRNGGKIKIQSAPGVGTTIIVYLPLEPARFEEKVVVRSMNPARILLVVEETSIRELLDQVLRSEGHEVVLAANEQQTQKILREDEKGFDLIMLDEHMAEEGFSTSIQESASEPAVISLSRWGRSQYLPLTAASGDSNPSYSIPLFVGQSIEKVRETLRRRRVPAHPA